MTPDEHESELFVDANDCLAERIVVDGQNITVHYRNLPDSDVTVVRGVRCTTALRTVIDLAPQLSTPELEVMVQHCLDRGLFTIGEAWDRVSQPDMVAYPGARVLRRLLCETEAGDG